MILRWIKPNLDGGGKSMFIDKNKFFRNITIQTCSSLEIEKALFCSFNYLRRFIPADQMTVNFFDDRTNEAVILASATGESSTKCNIRIKLSEKEKQWFFDPRVTPDLVLLKSAERAPIAEKFLKAFNKPDSSFLFLRLRIEGVLKGSITLRAEGRNRFTKDHLQLFSLLKDPWTIVLNTNRQYQELVQLKELLADDNRYLRKELERHTAGKIIGGEKGLKHVISMAAHVAPQNSPVLLLGETGVGKEVIAMAIHQMSPRAEGPFVKVNCGAIPDTLIDSELFGHERGAFTGAVSQKRGRFERANHGTIFLDEIGELPLPAQVRLLRVLQERIIERVGGTDPIKLDIRVIAATHRNLKNMIEKGRFREDLYYRLNVFPIEIPPLRHRKNDVEDLAEYFIRKKSQELGIYPPPQITPAALKLLKEYDWPGNVRELENLIERELILHKGGRIDLKTFQSNALNLHHTDQENFSGSPLTFREMVYRHLIQVMNLTEGRIQGKGGAAELLDLKPGTLRHKLRKLNIPFGRKKYL